MPKHDKKGLADKARDAYAHKTMEKMKKKHKKSMPKKEMNMDNPYSKHV